MEALNTRRAHGMTRIRAKQGRKSMDRLMAHTCETRADILFMMKAIALM